MTDIVKLRTQKSPLRKAQAAATHARILDAAAAVFADKGYEGTRIEDIAGEAGVAYPTVYKAFRNKPAVLTASVTRAMGAGEEGSLDRQVWFQEQLDAPDGETQLRLVARNARRLYERAGRLIEVVRIAAAGDEQAAALWTTLDAERVERSRLTAKRLATKATLRAPVPATARTLWALTLPEIFVLQVHHGDLSADRYQRWLADLLIAAVIVT
jgi:AcrR family transcriptional regulator